MVDLAVGVVDLVVEGLVVVVVVVVDLVGGDLIVRERLVGGCS